MREIKFRVWHLKEKKMYYRGYQKLTHVLLCVEDGGKNENRGMPAGRARYDDCQFLENTGLQDKNGREIFEADIVRVRTPDKIFCGVVDFIPDMFKSRGLHPLHALLERHGAGDGEELEIEILGNRYENPELADPNNAS